MKNKKILAVFAGLLAVMPFATSALTVDDLRAQIEKLLAQVATLQAQLAAVTGGGGGGGACPNLTRTLLYGSQGQDVLELQEYLVAERALDPSAVVGFFGGNTQTGVQTWQRANGVVSSGTPDSTGYGVVGPKTRVAIAAKCAASPPGGGTGTTGGTCATPPASPTCPAGQKLEIPKDANGCALQGKCVSEFSTSFAPNPSSGSFPLSVTFTLSSGNPTATYTVDFGDGAAAAFPQGASALQYHTYTTQGTFTATLSEKDAGGVVRVIKTATVTVQRPKPVSYATISIGNASGAAPLATQFVLAGANKDYAYTVTYGDGAFGVFTLSGTSGSLTHVYQNAGAYTATVTEREQCAGTNCTGYSRVIGTFVVNASGAGTTQAAASVTVTASTTPLTTTFSILNAGSSRTYTINYGNNNTTTFPSGSNAQLTYTYTTAGTYTATVTESCSNSAVCGSSTRTVATFTIEAVAPPVTYSQAYYQSSYYGQNSYWDGGN